MAWPFENGGEICCARHVFDPEREPEGLLCQVISQWLVKNVVNFVCLFLFLFVFGTERSIKKG